MKTTKLARLMILIASVAYSVTGSIAQAGSLYFEVEGGLSQFHQADAFFGGIGIPGTTGFGAAIGIGQFITLSNSALQLQLGIEDRLSLGSTSSTAIATQIPYPILRLQVARIYVGFGLSPFVWQRVNPLSGLDFFARAKGALAYLGEGGFLWPVTSKFSLGVGADAQYVNIAGNLSPKPILDFTASMRFNFGFFGESDGNSNEYKGWRYPFGNPIY